MIQDGVYSIEVRVYRGEVIGSRALRARPDNKRTCVACGWEFVVTDGRMIYCSHHCGMRHRKRRQRGQDD